MNLKNLEFGTGGGDSYITYIKEKIQDQKIWRAVYGGYLGKAWNETTVETDDDWYFVTKLVMHCLAENNSPKTKYQVPNRIASSDVALGYTLEDIQRKGEKVLNEAEKLYNYALNGTDNYKTAVVNLTKSGSVYTSGDNIVQDFTITANKEMKGYDISLTAFPTGTTYTKSGDTISIKIPKANITGDIDGLIRIINAQVKTCPAFYAESTDSEKQDYVVIADPYEKANSYAEFSLKTNNATLEILKIDEETKEVIPNTTFEISKNNNIVATVTTNSSGKATINNIHAGVYQVKEIKANANYEINNKVQTVELKYGETTEITISNDHKKGNLKIIKIDKDDKNLRLAAVEFDLFDSNGKLIKHLVTNSNGEAEVKDLRIGSYKLVETKTKKEYNLAVDQEVKVKWNETFEIKVENEKKKGQIKVVKVDSEKHEIKLEGVEFQVINQNNQIVETIKTNKNGEATTSRIPIGTYTLKEVSLGTNEEYILNEEVKTVVVEENKITNIQFENDHKKGDLRIVKVDKDDHDLTLGAVEFDLIDSDGNIVRHLTTDVDGIAEAKELRTGNYVLREVKTKKEYNLTLDQNVKIKWNETFELKVENEKKKGQIKVIKVDSEKQEIKLEGVEFQVINKKNQIIETIKTNADGEATTSRIPMGTYTLKEVSLGTNENYILSDEIKTVVVEENKITNIKFENEHKKGSLKIYKVDLDNNTIPVPDVEFEIIDKDGFKYIAKTDENGIAQIDNIRTGMVSIKETKTNEIYKLSDETYNAEIKWNETAEITIKNEKLKGQIEVFKVDAEDKEIKLEGVEFQVINSNDEIVETITTNKDGYAITSRIPIGEYRLKEIKTDDMHILNDEIIKVDVTTEVISKLDITNERIKGQIKIIKTSEDDNFINGEKAGTPIQNVKFEVYDSNNNIVDEITTSADGTAITKLLDKGSYYIKEVEAGEWYLLNNEIFTSEIKEHQEIVNVEITNESEKPDVDIEKTGIIQTTANQEIRYDFKIKNTGNVPLNNFTWYDYLPTDYVRITKLITGTYNQDLDYAIYYKTNKNDYKLLKDNLNTKVNNYIDFTEVELEKDEYITEFKADFGTVDIGFESVTHPYIFVRVNSDVKNDDTFTNKTRIEGDNKGYLVWDEDDHPTKTYEKKVKVKKLPRTGM